jgi:hypothetical protein
MQIFLANRQATQDVLAQVLAERGRRASQIAPHKSLRNDNKLAAKADRL